MYKIYINENILELKDAKDIKNNDYPNAATLAQYRGKKPILLAYIDMLKKTNKFKHIILYDKNIKRLRKDFKSLFVIVEAAGGIVENENKKILFIYRKGYWDLPKGKREKGEKKRITAVREVEEETGVKNISVHEKIIITYHLFRLKNNKRALKKTHWYAMKALHQAVSPQLEEDITKVKWGHAHKFISSDIKIYRSILMVLKTYLNKHEKILIK